MTKPSKTAFIIGFPVGHSRSPLIHNYWLKEYGIEGQYLHNEISPDELATFINQLQPSQFIGGNVTIPHKEQVFSLLNHMTDEANELKAVNTLYWENDLLIGHNTDGYGFIAHLKNILGEGLGKIKTVLVLGAGGAARPIVSSLIKAGVNEIKIANRTRSRAQDLASDFETPGCELTVINWDDTSRHVEAANLIVNTTSLGMWGNPPLNIDLTKMKSGTFVYDIVYTPIKTNLLKQAEERGGVLIDGLGMLLHQAVPGFEKWFGVRPQVTEELHKLILADVEQKI